MRPDCTAATIAFMRIPSLDGRDAGGPTARMSLIRSVCVYCGASAGAHSDYAAGAAVLGRALAESGIGLIYGGASIGVMGILARSALDHGGHVTGIIPKFLIDREGMFDDVSELIITETMHERKQLMFDKADGFVALPGGIGTLEELVEMMTWLQLGQHKKPIVLGNLAGFWDPLIDLLQHMRDESFITSDRPISFNATAKAEEIVPLLVNGAAGEASFRP